MNPSLMAQLDDFTRGLVPLGITFVLVLVETLPLPMPGMGAVAPALSLIALYHWAIYRPDLMPAIGVFAVGALLDVVTGASLGVNTLVLLIVYAMALSQRRFLLDKPFSLIWAGFVLTAVFAGLLYWVILSLLNNALLNPTRLIVQLGITVAIFPAVSWLLARLQQAVVRDAQT
ncbi:MAG: rod shape-determining protein MreD [Alphaproteobacteria bacterium]|nr:rod shape-determining protein MreD [Alphaproteobacteria bacterium]